MSDWFAKAIGVKTTRSFPRPRGDYVPSMRDSFYTEGHGSGYTKSIDWNAKTVTVRFSDFHTYEYDWTDIEGTWTDRYGGIYWLKS